MAASLALFLALTSLPNLPAAPAAVALLPTVGTAKEDQRRDLDGVLRQALLDDDKIDLLSPVETREHLMSLAEMGLVCLPEDVGCLVKLGIVANVAVVLVPVGNKAGAGKEIDVELVVIDVATSQRLRTVTGHFNADDLAKAKELVQKALDVKKASKPDPLTDTDGKPPTATDNKPPPTGAIVTGVAGSLGVLALGGAITCDVVYSGALGKLADAKTRQNVAQPLGAVLWVTTGLAAAGVGAGVYLLVTTPPDDGLSPGSTAPVPPAR